MLVHFFTVINKNTTWINKNILQKDLELVRLQALTIKPGSRVAIRQTLQRTRVKILQAVFFYFKLPGCS